ncbi:MAG: phage baseplate assembly protein V [Bacteroidales bacterium]|jgi:uncharacterized protein involved in type VI secretion and phage assembly|nr:phage baseplate assembly protein V [Bacteroidales bacterium]
MAILTEISKITINGNSYDEYIFSDLTLTQENQKPNELRFKMHKNTLLENEKDISFSLSNSLLGAKIECTFVTIRRDRDGQIKNEALEFTGIIFNVNALRNYMKAGLIIEITAYSPDYLLYDSPHCYSYENQNLESIVSHVTSQYKIPMSNKPLLTDEIPYIVQYNETNYQFIKRLAQRFGEWLYYDGKEIVFGKIKKEDCLELYPDIDILHYQYNLDMEHLDFSHSRHDYLEYENVTNDAISYTEKVKMHNMTDIAYERSKEIYNIKTSQNLHSSVSEDNYVDETEHSAKVEGLGKKARMMLCHGITNRADLRIGSVIKIKEFYEKENFESGFCLHDELLICKITHSVDINGNYENKFTAIPATCEYPPYSFCDLHPLAEAQRAIVKDNKDPEGLGRIRVQFLWQELVEDDTLLTPWIRIVQPHGGDNKGFYFIPEIDEEVMVGFENGNAEKPYVVGTLYHGKQRPGDNWYNDTNDIKAIRTRNGHTIEIYDEGEGGYIKIYDNEKENYILTYSTDEKLIKLESKGNIELYAENDIIMEAKNNINMKAGVDMNREAGENIAETAGNNISVSAGENISVDAGNDMDTSIGNNDSLYVGSNQTIEIGSNKDETISEKYQLTAENIREEANQKIQIYSQTHEQKADKEMKLDGGGDLDLYGKKVKIN